MERVVWEELMKGLDMRGAMGSRGRANARGRVVCW